MSWATAPREGQTKWYSLYLLNASVSQADFRDAAEAWRFQHPGDHFFTDLVSPLLFTLPGSGVMWLLEIGPQEQRLQAWRVYARPVSRHVCTITLRFKSDVPRGEVIVN